MLMMGKTLLILLFILPCMGKQFRARQTRGPLADPLEWDPTVTAAEKEVRFDLHIRSRGR